MINGERSSNSRSRSICILNLVGSSGSGSSDARSLSPISRTIARVCVWSMSMRLGMTKPRSGKKARAAGPSVLRLPTPSQLSRLRARLAILNGTVDRRFSLSARALVLRTAVRLATFGYPRHAPCWYRRATVSRSQVAANTFVPHLPPLRRRSFLLSPNGPLGGGKYSYRGR
jgi:hypothetical protein